MWRSRDAGPINMRFFPRLTRIAIMSIYMDRFVKTAMSASARNN